jgi:2,5-dihydroxypyridine 5,6-dioxygenase
LPSIAHCRIRFFKNEWYSLLTAVEALSIFAVRRATPINADRTIRMESAIRTQELNPGKLTLLYRRQFELCRVAAGQTIAVVSDLGTRREYIQSAFAAAEELGADIYEMCVNAIPGWTSVGVPTIGQCKGTLEALLAADMVLIFHVPLFSKWLREVMGKGVRVQMVIDAPDDLYQLQSPPGLKEAVLHAQSLYEKTKEVRVTSKAGTDLAYRCGEYPVMSQYGFADEPGHFDHWGVGLLHTFPNEGSASGQVVIAPGDIVILPYCRYVRDAVRLEVREGHVTRIEGGVDAALMREWLAQGKVSAEDRDPYAVSHLGWGLNPQCRWDAIALYGDAPERSRAAARSFPGNFLFSTGPNTQGGGKRTTRGHYDVPMRGCTIALDGRVVVDEGRLADPQMIVPRVAR